MRLVLAAVCAAGVAAQAGTTPPLPQRLSETGLYLPGTHTVDPRNRPFAPQYPLWTDGAQKSRWVQLPAGARIDARVVDAWTLPRGTRFWKEFRFGGRKVETRMSWRTAEGNWSFAAYVWNEAQTDATLAPEAGVVTSIDVAPGVPHVVPAREDCLACHDGAETAVIGFTALQLSPDRDPGALHGEPLPDGATTLRTLADEARFEPARPEFVSRPPRIGGDATTRAALGYLTGNCGHCHHERTSTETVRFPLAMPAYGTDDAVTRTIQALRTRTTKWAPSGGASSTTAAATPLLTAGNPAASALLLRMRSRRPSSQMPPLGTSVADQEAVRLVSAWITQLERAAPALRP